MELEATPGSKRKVRFTKRQLKNANKQIRNPSLKAHDFVENPPDDAQKLGNGDVEIEYARKLALHNAFGLHKQAWGNDSPYKDLDSFLSPGLPPNWSTLRKSVRIKIGTDCSGMEAPIQAMKNLGIPYHHIFSCDFDDGVKNTIEANFKPEVMYGDITKRDNSKVQHVDIYIAGFPCQPFSTAGKQQGFADERGRGVIFYNILDYIERKRPSVFILENVKGLVTLENGKYMKSILSSLQSIKTKKSQVRGGDPRLGI